MNVSPRLADDARVIAKHGTPAQKRAVRVGKVTVSAMAKQINSRRKAATKSAQKAKPKNGQVRFDWDKFYKSWDTLVRLVDDVGDEHHCKITSAAEALRDELQRYKEHFEAFYRAATNQEPARR
jgi:hypothetical protein